jgi:hypothetical protein
VPVDGFVAAAFRHRTSRADDPLLHTHVLVANLARTTDDGVWRTLDSRKLFAHAKTAGILYQAQLRFELTRRLGVAWQPVVNGHADIDGVDRQLIETFSQRRDGRLVAADASERRYTTRGLLLTEQRAINRSLDRHTDQTAIADRRPLDAALRRRSLTDEQTSRTRSGGDCSNATRATAPTLPRHPRSRAALEAPATPTAGRAGASSRWPATIDCSRCGTCSSPPGCVAARLRRCCGATSIWTTGLLSVTRAAVEVKGKVDERELTKSSSSRRAIELAEQDVAVLRQHRKVQLEEQIALHGSWRDVERVFTSPVGGRLYPPDITRAFHVLTNRAGLPRIRLHDLRHTFATLSAEVRRAHQDRHREARPLDRGLHPGRVPGGHAWDAA